jgi:hypothetical protein
VKAAARERPCSAEKAMGAALLQGPAELGNMLVDRREAEARREADEPRSEIARLDGRLARARGEASPAGDHRETVTGI